jgi:hypothetical protein
MVAATALGVVVGVRPDILHRSSKILQRQQNLETEETAKEKVTPPTPATPASSPSS